MAAHLVQNAAEIDPHWLDAVECVGVTAGASAPENLVQDVVHRLVELGPNSEVEPMPLVDEGVVFAIPSTLRG